MVQLNNRTFEALERANDRQLAKLDAEIELLREALRRYGDRAQMAQAPAELRPVIDAALAEPE